MNANQVVAKVFKTLNRRDKYVSLIVNAETLLAEFCAARLCEPPEVNSAIVDSERCDLIIRIIRKNPDEAFKVFMKWRLTR